MKKYLIFLLVIISGSCVDVYKINSGVGAGLVVDGWITNQPGPYNIKLSRSIPYNNSIPLKVYSIPESNAQVSVTDSRGVTEILSESPAASGIYPVKVLQGVVGRTYQLKLQTSNGNKYSSSIEEMKPAADLDAIEARYQISETLVTNANGSSVVQKKEDFGIYVKIKDKAEYQNFYRWQANGVFEFFSITDASNEKQCWAPAIDRLESGIQVTSDLDFNGQPYERYIGLFPYDRLSHYLLTVRQQSLTEQGYNFLKKIADQQTSTGTLFDPPPNAVLGNIYNESNPNEVVLGYFGAVSQVQKQLLVDRFGASGRKNPSREIAPTPGFCRLQGVPGATNIKWPGF